MHAVHLTSVHPRYDIRILTKQCRSLAASGYLVSLVVADGDGDETDTEKAVSIYDIGGSKGRLDRIRNAPHKVYRKALELDGDIYHLHDPELIPIGLKLKKLGKVVIFDSHEDIPKQILAKSYLNFPSKWLLSKVFSLYERWACNKFDAVISATPFIREKFEFIGISSVEINNYPILGDFVKSSGERREKKLQVTYVGGIERIRGVQEIVQAISLVRPDIRFILAGTFSDDGFEREVTSELGWRRTDYRGWLGRTCVSDLLNESMAGLVTLHPLTNYLDALPVKMFEYMAAGLPVISSDFPLWNRIIEGNKCGLCVNPLSPTAIAEAIEFVLTNPTEAEQMGANGRRAVREQYNWDLEKVKLVKLYEDLLRD